MCYGVLKMICFLTLVYGCYSGSACTSVQFYETDEDEEPSGVSRTRFNHTPGRVPGLPTYQDSSR